MKKIVLLLFVFTLLSCESGFDMQEGENLYTIQGYLDRRYSYYDSVITFENNEYQYFYYDNNVLILSVRVYTESGDIDEWIAKYTYYYELHTR